MGRKSKNKSNPLQRSKGDHLTPAQQEAVVRTYFTCGSKAETARILKISHKAVNNALAAAQNDPQLMAARGQALDQMAGKIHSITDQVLESVTPEELITTRHEVKDIAGNLLRIVTEGPSLKDKALAIGILSDKQLVLAKARNEAAQQLLGAGGGSAALMLPETIEGKKQLIAQKIKKLRIIDMEFDTGETGKTLDMALNRVGITEDDIEEAEVVEVGMAPFD